MCIRDRTNGKEEPATGHEAKENVLQFEIWTPPPIAPRVLDERP